MYSTIYDINFVHQFVKKNVRCRLQFTTSNADKKPIEIIPDTTRFTHLVFDLNQMMYLTISLFPFSCSNWMNGSIVCFRLSWAVSHRMPISGGDSREKKMWMLCVKWKFAICVLSFFKMHASLVLCLLQNSHQMMSFFFSFARVLSVYCVSTGT